MEERSLQPGYESTITRRASIITNATAEPPSPDVHDIAHYKNKRERTVRENFKRYVTEIVSKEGNTMHQKKDGEFFKRIEGEVDKINKKIERKKMVMEILKPTTPGKHKLEKTTSFQKSSNASLQEIIMSKKRHTLM